MLSTVSLKVFARITFSAFLLLAGTTGCGGLTQADAGASTVDAPVAPVWPAEITHTSCARYDNFVVGSYVVQTDYWNDRCLQGDQCIAVNTATGAFVVDPGPQGNCQSVSSFPNVTYGCAYANCSPKSMLPMPISELTSLSSTWKFAVGGGPKDAWNVSYEIWFCPDANCGATGFPGGLELMIWLDYQNAGGYKDHLATVSLDGYSWDVWGASMAAGGATDSWNYMNYIVKGPKLSSVKDLDLMPFIQDAIARGYAKDSWYLFAIQAGMEVRQGGMPFISDSFLVTVNGVTPNHAPLPSTGPACDAGAPTADGQLTIADGYVTVGSLHGYVDSWANPGKDSAPEVISCSTPVAGPTALCMAGAITADSSYGATAGIGFYLNQDVGARDPDGGAINLGTITIPNTLQVFITKSGGALNGNNSVRAQLIDDSGTAYCYGGSLDAPIPITKFNTACWNNTGTYATATTAFTELQIMVPSAAASEQDFSYCLTNVVVQ
jgi:hypothetical protein